MRVSAIFVTGHSYTFSFSREYFTMIQKVSSFLKKDTVLTIALALAVLSMFIIPPSAGYLGYLDLHTLILLFGLMTATTGLQNIGFFRQLGELLLLRIHSLRQLEQLLILLCFFSSMLITNDVALITFVPFALELLRMVNRKDRIVPVVVCQTLAANLGSMTTPVGNPQNLYLASAFSVSTGTFLMRMLPLTALSLILLVAAACMLPSASVDIASQPVEEQPEPKKLAVYLALFVVCLGCVSHLIPYPIMLVLVLVTLLFTNRALFHKADYFLLLTFVFFFLFIGNVQNIPAVSDLLHKLIRGRELGAGILLSQCISNVPAAILLSSFTDQVTPLLYGVNIGGLGTLIASLASLISYRFYVGTENAHTGRYMKVFTLYNVIFLVILALVAWKIL